jgi:hypothetical protein
VNAGEPYCARFLTNQRSIELDSIIHMQDLWYGLLQRMLI